jgi:hypothetical protein
MVRLSWSPVLYPLPKLSRKNLVRLIENYGGELLKELRKTMSLVGPSFLVRAIGHTSVNLA